MRRSISWGSLALTAAVLVPAAAGARSHHPPCSPSKDSKSPRLTSPCNHAVIAAGTRVTFKVRDVNSKAQKDPPYLNLTKTPPRRGVLKPDSSGDGLFEQLHPVHGHPGLFTDRPTLFHFPGYWAVTAGKYYVQVSQIDCSVPGCTRYSPVETITVR